MSDKRLFMPWVDHLPEVGDPIRRERAKLVEAAQEAIELERHAVDLRVQVASGQVQLLQRVMGYWTLADIQQAAETADRHDAAGAQRARVGDLGLREQLRTLDGWHLGIEALRAFHAGVILRPDLLTTATDEERLQTLVRVVAWWNLAGAPVYERLAGK